MGRSYLMWFKKKSISKLTHTHTCYWGFWKKKYKMLQETTVKTIKKLCTGIRMRCGGIMPRAGKKIFP